VSANIRATITTNGIGVERAKELAKSEKWNKLTKKISPRLEDMTLPELAEETGENIEAVKQTQKRAFRKFKKRFERIPDYKVYLEDF